MPMSQMFNLFMKQKYFLIPLSEQKIFFSKAIGHFVASATLHWEFTRL